MNISKPPNNCPVCLGTVIQLTEGKRRPRRYCSDPCKQKAYRQRKAETQA